MANPGWTSTESPFHAGELAVQSRLGVQVRIDQQGRRFIRDYITEQQQRFFAQLPYVTVGTVDAYGHLWASILVGKPGFLSAVNQRTLRVTAQPLPGDPLAKNLTVGADIGFLGIELRTRRRNRLNGIVSEIHTDGFEIQVKQTFGNCPQYIQARTFDHVRSDPGQTSVIHPLLTLSTSEKALIATADTFFIATAYQQAKTASASGVDVSHRGGKPGFVRIDNDRTLTTPDFSGNLHFNTFGNLELNPQAGLLFIDFSQGHLMQLTGEAEVIWNGPEACAYEGAERLMRFHLTQGYRIENALPLRWSAPEFSPLLKNTGHW